MNKVFGNVPILWINLNDSVNRYNKMVMQLKNYNNNHRIEAVDGRDKNLFFKNYDLKYENDYNFSTGLIAVLCSHIKAINYSFNKNYEYACIFEDDVHFELVDNFLHTIHDIIKKAPMDWDIIQLYYCQNLNNMFDDYKKNGLKIYKGVTYSGSAYIINKNGMKKILKKVDTDGISKFHFKQPVTAPEIFLFCDLNYFMVNCPFIYYYDNEMTFDDYFEDKTGCKKECQTYHLQGKNTIINFFKNFA